MKLFKTQITIWTTYNTTEIDLEDLGREATRGDAYCTRCTCTGVEHPTADPDWYDTDFFETPEETEKRERQAMMDEAVLDDLAMETAHRIIEDERQAAFDELHDEQQDMDEIARSRKAEEQE